MYPEWSYQNFKRIYFKHRDLHRTNICNFCHRKRENRQLPLSIYYANKMETIRVEELGYNRWFDVVFLFFNDTYKFRICSSLYNTSKRPNKNQYKVTSSCHRHHKVVVSPSNSPIKAQTPHSQQYEPLQDDIQPHEMGDSGSLRIIVNLFHLSCDSTQKLCSSHPALMVRDFDPISPWNHAQQLKLLPVSTFNLPLSQICQDMALCRFSHASLCHSNSLKRFELAPP